VEESNAGDSGVVTVRRASRREARVALGAPGATGSKKHRGEWAPNPGTDRTGSEFPAKCAGNPCQSCQSRGRSWVAMKSPWQFFMSFRGPKAHPNRVEKAPAWPASGRLWSFYILLVTFMGISPGEARESSPWREPWEQTRTARSPEGAKEPFHGDSPIAGHERPSYAPTGLARLGAGPTGLTPWAIF
jgi:hypothetical protein